MLRPGTTFGHVDLRDRPPVGTGAEAGPAAKRATVATPKGPIRAVSPLQAVKPQGHSGKNGRVVTMNDGNDHPGGNDVALDLSEDDFLDAEFIRA